VNKDIYSYLENEELDLRFKKALEMIGSVSGKVILDLNCGSARMLQYLPGEFSEYIANDINEKLLEIAKKWPAKGKMQFVLCRDDEIINYLNKVDIFMHFGINAGVNEGYESKTEFETFKKIVEKFLPETVVCETWFYYEENYKIISQRGDFLKPSGYKEIGSFVMKHVMERILVVYKRS